MATYYVSNSGDDANPGTDINFPRETIYGLGYLTFVGGDTILIKRGDFFRENAGLFLEDQHFSSPLTVSSYGEGALPVLTSSELLTAWADQGGGIYTTPASKVYGCVAEDSYPLKMASDITLVDGFWFVETDILYYKPTSLTPQQHTVEGGFGNMLTLDNMSNVNISELYLYNNSSGLHLQNVQSINVNQCIIRCSNYNGIPVRSRSSASGEDCRDVTIKGCTISWNANGIYIVAEGEAQEFHNIKVIGCALMYNCANDTFDHSTIDGHGLGIQSSIGCEFTGNEVAYNKTGPCYWVTGNLSMVDNIMTRNFVHHNETFGICFGGEGPDNQYGNITCFNIISDNGWRMGPTDEDGGSFRIRQTFLDLSVVNYFPNNTMSRNEIQTFVRPSSDFGVYENNISFEPTYYHIKFSSYIESNSLNKNIYYPDTGNKFYANQAQDVDFPSWQTFTGQEVESFASDPLFNNSELVRPTDFIPDPSSPARIGGPLDLPPLLVDEYNKGDFFGSSITEGFIGAVIRS